MTLFFYGANSFEARQQIARLITQYKLKSGNDLGIERIDGSKATIGQLSASLQASPFLANSRLVIIEDLGSNKVVAPKIESLIEGVPSTTVAVFYDAKVDQRTSYFKALKAASKAVEFKLLDNASLQRWVKRYAEGMGATIDRPAIGRLLDLAGDDQWRLSNELAKLVNHNTGISIDAVNELVEPSYTETIFDLVEAMTNGRADQAFQLYHRLRQDGQSEMYILSMVIWQLRNLLVAKSAGKISAPELAKTAGMSPYVAGKMLAKRHLFTDEYLQTVFIQAVETDYGIKSGVGDSETMVEQLIMRTAGTAPRV